MSAPGGALAVLEAHAEGIALAAKGARGKNREEILAGHAEFVDVCDAVAELIEANAELRRAISFMDEVRASKEETIATGVNRDAVEWIESASRKCVDALARVGGAS